MAITGTIRSITPRWLRATPGVLLAIAARVTAVARGRMRTQGALSAVGRVTAVARRQLRTHGVFAAAAAVVAGALHLARRVVPLAVAGGGRLSAVSRGRNRSAPAAPTIIGKISAVAASVRLRTLSDGTPRTLSTGTPRTFL